MSHGHARLGPSSAHRWLRCPTSIALSEQAPYRPAGTAAIAGTILHGVFERRLLRTGDFTIGELERLLELNMDATRARRIVEQGTAAAIEVMERYGVNEFLTEVRVDPGESIGRTDFWGTADLVAANADTQTLIVGDLKTGRTRVEAEANDQLLCYAMGARSLLGFEPKQVVLAIFQPPVWGSRAAVWCTDLTTLNDFAAFAQEQARRTDQARVEPIPSREACTWCPAKTVCPVHRQAFHGADDM